MRLSHLIGRRYKERPAEAALESHAFLLRGGYVRQVANGIYSLLPAGFRVAHKIEQIIREEMDRVGGQEVLMPVVLPAELWQESGRYESVGSELLRFEDRTGHPMLLGMTHEEAVLHLCRHEATSYRHLPFMVYQIQTKFRDEPRSRGGLIRVREFTMKDAYSFHMTDEDLEATYQQCLLAYRRIFARAGIPETAVVQSDSGMMGGKIAHEFMLLCEAGEDTVVGCDTCEYLANSDVAEAMIDAVVADPRPLEKVHTPGTETIEAVAAFLRVETTQTAKAVFYRADADGKPVLAIIRGDVAINETKLAKILQAQPVPADEAAVAATGAVAGYASPMGLDADTVRIVVDHTVAESSNLVTGANEVDHHCRNFNLTRDLPGVATVDIAQVRAGDRCRFCQGGRIVLHRGIEVGNIFQLGRKYTEAMGMSVLDENGKAHVPTMGCYGIGVGRLMSSVMEAKRDKFGPLWPMSLAPWHVQVCALKMDKGGVKEAAEQLYADLQAAGVEAVFDDRNERPGVQFAEADLLGAPIRLIVGERNLPDGNVEWKRRDTGESGVMPLAAATATVQQWIADALGEIEAVADEQAS